MNDTTQTRQTLSCPERVAVDRGRAAAARMRPEPALIETLRIPGPTNEAAARFLDKVTFTEAGHWLWTAGTNGNGYGRFSIGGRNLFAHRIAWSWRHGVQIPDGLSIDHLCRIRGCVCPDHLEAVSQRENTLRGNTIVAANAAMDRCPQGHLLAGINLVAAMLRRGQRMCRVCHVVRARAHAAVSPGNPNRERIAQAAVSRLTGDETPESLGLLPAPIHLRVGLVSGAWSRTGKQLELVGITSTVSTPHGVVA